MQIEKRINKNGTSYYSFIFYDTKLKKRVRLSKKDIKDRFGKDILTEEEALECLKLLEAQFQLEVYRIEKKLSWMKDFYNFQALLDQYVVIQKKNAPNSWKNNEFYLKHYVLPFFLTVKKLNNIELWADYFDEYKDWLENKAVQVRSKALISYGSKNHAIKALNTFLSHLYEKRLIHRAHKCKTFGEHLQGRRDIDDVIFQKEMETIYLSLKENNNNLEATFFRFLYFSGMRFSEGLAISLADIHQGEMIDRNNLIAKRIKLHGLVYFGYIISDSQVDEKFVRFPFKGKKEINERYSRIIPILDSTLWNDLVDLSEKLYSKWNRQESEKKNMFLFKGIDDTTSTVRLKAAFERSKLKYRSWHCCRHSRATWLIGETGDEVLAKTWLGHSSPRIFERYNHLYQSIIRNEKSQQTINKNSFGLKRVNM